MAAPFQDSAVLFGDSITQQQEVPNSLQSRFSAAYRRTLDIYNRGYSGYNSRWQLFPTIFAKTGEPASTVRLVTIWFGANDSVLAGTQDHKRSQHVPIEEYEDNLRFFIESLSSPDSPYAAAHTPGLNIVLVTPPPLYPDMMEGVSWASERRQEVTKAYAEVVKRLGKEYAAKGVTIGVVDMFEGVLAAGGGEGEGLREYLSDGLHLTGKGYGVFWEQFTQLVKTTFRGRGIDFDDLQDLPYRLPAWDEVDSEKPDVLSGEKLPSIRTLKN